MPGLRQLVTVAAALIVLAGCGSSSNDSGSSSTAASTTAAPAAPKLITATLTEYKITPSTTKFPPGHYTFRATNKGKKVHIFEVEGPGSENETDEIQPGQTKDLVLNIRNSGSWIYYCPIHKAKGMVTKFTVT